jgi:hypothetical protein
MENLAHSSNTPATDAAADLLTRIAVDPANDDHYPDGTVLIPADSGDTSTLISRAIANRRPIALVFPDGSDIVARPPDSHGLGLLILLMLLGIADFLRRRPNDATFVPREWVTNFHAVDSRREPQPTPGPPR